MNCICRSCGKESPERFAHGYQCDDCHSAAQRVHQRRRAEAERRQLAWRAKQQAKQVVLGQIQQAMPEGIHARKLGENVHHALMQLEDSGLAYWNREQCKWFAMPAAAAE